MPDDAAKMTGAARPPKPANKRGAARLYAVQALYQMDLANTGLAEVVAEYENMRLGKELDGNQYVDADLGWFRGILAGVIGEQRRIDPIVHDALPPDWPLARIHTLLRAILRAGVYELKMRTDVPARVIINEYVDIAHAFLGEEERRMVNGVLDRVAWQLRPEELQSGAGRARDGDRQQP